MENQPAESPSRLSHRRQFFWSILLPVLLVTTLVIAGAVLATTRSVAVTQTWADVALIWMILPGLIFGLLFLAILIGGIYAMVRLLQVLPYTSAKVRGIVTRVEGGARKAADGTAQPIFWLGQTGAVLKSIFKPSRKPAPPQE